MTQLKLLDRLPLLVLPWYGYVDQLQFFCDNFRASTPKLAITKFESKHFDYGRIYDSELSIFISVFVLP